MREKVQNRLIELRTKAQIDVLDPAQEAAGAQPGAAPADHAAAAAAGCRGAAGTGGKQDLRIRHPNKRQVTDGSRITAIASGAGRAGTVLPPIAACAGVRFATSGVRYRGRPDVLVALLEPGTTIAGCFTPSKTRSAAVDWDRANLANGKARAFLVNAGNANAFTGAAGMRPSPARWRR